MAILFPNDGGRQSDASCVALTFQLSSVTATRDKDISTEFSMNLLPKQLCIGLRSIGSVKAEMSEDFIADCNRQEAPQVPSIRCLLFLGRRDDVVASSRGDDFRDAGDVGSVRGFSSNSGRLSLKCRGMFDLSSANEVLNVMRHHHRLYPFLPSPEILRSFHDRRRGIDEGDEEFGRRCSRRHVGFDYDCIVIDTCSCA